MSFCAFGVLAQAGIASVACAQPAAMEYDVKAALLFNFSQFVEWPGLEPSADAPFVIGILGTDPFGKALDDVVAGERAHGRSIEIRRFRSVEDVNAQILFIGGSEAARVDQVLAALKGKPVLTVSDMPPRAFLRAGGMIALVSESNSIRLQIDQEAARACGLAISAKLLQLAEIVHE